MPDRTVVGPVVMLDGRRLLVRSASLDEPEDADTPRLDAVDGSLASGRRMRDVGIRHRTSGMPRRRRGHVRAMPTTT
jgi:hypothetical protein